MNHSIGDGLAVIGIAAGIVGYVHVTHQSRLKKIEIIHQERMTAMDKGIPLPEFPFDPKHTPNPHERNVIAILGLVLLSLSLGTMLTLYLTLTGPEHSFWVAPLPFAFLGAGFLAYHLLNKDSGR